MGETLCGGPEGFVSKDSVSVDVVGTEKTGRQLPR